MNGCAGDIYFGFEGLRRERLLLRKEVCSETARVFAFPDFASALGCYLECGIYHLVFASHLVLRVVVELRFTSLYTKRYASLGHKLDSFEEV
jgi:hypothetical protein